MLRHIPVKSLATQAHAKVLSLGTSTVRSKDFFGINDITSKDVAGAFKSLSRLPKEDLESKYDMLYKPRYVPENEEIREHVVFGAIRRDSDNVPKSHGQYEPSNINPKVNSIDVKQKFVPDEGPKIMAGISTHLEPSDPQYETRNITLGNAPYKISEVESVEPISAALNLLKTERPALVIASDYRNCAPVRFFFESEQIARKSLEPEQSVVMYSRAPSSIRKIRQPEADMALIDEYDTDTISESKTITRSKTVTATPSPTEASTKLSGHQIEAEELESAIEEASEVNDNKPKLTYEPKVDKTPLHELEPGSEEYMERFLEEDKFEEFDKALDIQYSASAKVKKASDYLKEIRSKQVEPKVKGLQHRLEKPEMNYPLNPTVKLDSKGFNNYEHQVPNWRACRREQILAYVRKSIIYNNYDILALNKPYGIASHEKPGEKEPYDINSLVKELAKELRLESIHLAHRLDKNTTGVLLFATSPDRAKSLHKLFRSDRIKKTYWCITSRIPDPTEGIIDIPIGEYKCAGKLRSCPVIDDGDKNKQLSRKFREARRAITEYRVLNANQQAALVEVKPRTGVKHQIRCHLGFAMNTPILGDHKYSHLDRVAPQTLTAPLLRLLHLRPQKVRTLPLHLHAKTIVIPNAKANGETLFIEAPLPAHFAQNLKALRLKPGIQK